MTAWHVATKDGQLKILQEIRDLGEEKINKLLLATDNDGRTVLHLAAEGYKLEVFQRVFEWAKILAKEKVNKLLLDTDHKREAAWHAVARQGKLKCYRKYGIGLKRISQQRR